MTFQMTFAIITPALIAGAFADRMKFSAMLWFMGLWSLLIYSPIAHMMWEPSGYWAGKGVLDFAGGTVVHINAGIAGLVCALVLGKRLGYGKEPMAPHNLTLTLIGASLLWVGWFGFNAGSAVAADGRAGMAMAVTQLATAVAALAWMFTEWIAKGKPSVLGIASGAVAGLVAITPASGFVGVTGAFVIGIAAGVLCFFAATAVKRMFGYDDSLDAFGVHCIGGIVGALLTGVFNVKDISGADGRLPGAAGRGRDDAGLQRRRQLHHPQGHRHGRRLACLRRRGARRPRHQSSRRARGVGWKQHRPGFLLRGISGRFGRPFFCPVFSAPGALFLRPRMRLVVDLGQVLEVEVRVNLRAGNARVTQQLLHGAQIAGGLQQVRGERMSQHVRVDVPSESPLDRPSGEPLLDRPRREPPSRAADEHGLALGRRQCRPQRQPRFKREARRLADGNDALLGAFAEHAHLALRQVERRQVEPGKLGHAQARRIRDLEQRAVAHREHVFVGDRDQAHCLVGREDRRQMPRRPGRLEAGAWIVLERALVIDRETVEGTPA